MLRYVTYSVVGLMSLFGGLALAQSPEPIQVDIAAQPVGDALNQFAEQSGLQVVLYADDAKGIDVAGVSGQFDDATVALDSLLASTGLEYSFINDRTVAVASVQKVAEKGGDSASGNGRTAPGPVMIAQASETQNQNQGIQATTERLDTNKQERPLEEIIVTGSHIRGGNSSSPVIAFDRTVIEQSGYSTTQQLVQSAPQNLNNFSDTTFGEVNGGAPGSIGQGSGANLRGLGGDSTLVLLNGRRLAPAGLGDYVDISLIPLSAIESVQMLTDGASAIYGSDAVAGVVNIILRERTEGAETRLQYGTSSKGDSDELRLGQSFGHSWESGSALLSYEYFSRDALSAADRDFVDLASGGLLESLQLAPDQERHGILVSIAQDVGGRIQMSGDFLSGRRESNLAYKFAGLPEIPIHSDGRQSSGSLGATIDLANDWQFNASGTFGRNETEQQSVVPQLINSRFQSRTSLWSLDAGADGTVGRLPGGDVRLAFGTQYRKEKSRDQRESTGGISVELEREVLAGYAELLMPVVDEEMAVPGVRYLELTAAARFEDYSDFGSTTNPKLGISWHPLAGLNVRGTYGRSYKAPLLSELNPASMQPVAYSLIDHMSATGFTPGLVLFGGGRDLEPETAKTWTVGLDVEPGWMQGLMIQATYFEIAFEDRITSPLPSDARLFSVLTDPTVAQFIARDPEPTLVAELFDSPAFQDQTGTGVQPTDIGVIADGRVVNTAESQVRGIDLSAKWHTDLPLGQLDMGVMGNYLFQNSFKLLPGTPTVETVDTIYHQPALRLRANASWSYGALTTSAFVNHTGSYSDDREPTVAGPDQRSTVASWTTFDVTATWSIGQSFDSRLSDGTTLSLTALNLLDRDPPFVASTLGIHFDGVNATPMGRWISLRLTRQW